MRAVFISDLHLNPDQPEITARFFRFIDWAAENTAALYILGDFFHAWPGDDGLDPWSQEIIQRLNNLSRQGVALYYMHGNRDFLIGEVLAQQAGFTLLKDPCVIYLNHQAVLLSHGDSYCTADVSHQYFRMLTRNRAFKWLFMKLPFKMRSKMVMSVRRMSENNRQKPQQIMDVVPAALLKSMKKFQTKILIHGHTHKPGLTSHELGEVTYHQYVLSDWDDAPRLLCYDDKRCFYFTQIA